MILLPAIDLYEKKVVRLTRGDYAQMTVYNDDPVAQAGLFQEAGAQWLHTVDLEGAKDGSTPNYSVIEAICKDTSLKVEIGGGIRSLDTIQKYLDAGVERVILGTKAVTDPAFLEESLDKFGSHIAVGVDIKDGKIAIKGWLETAQDSVEDFFTKLCKLGVHRHLHRCVQGRYAGRDQCRSLPSAVPEVLPGPHCLRWGVQPGGFDAP